MAKPQKISKWGNSLAVRIPQDVAERAGIRAGDEVAVTASSGKLTVMRKKQGYRIEDFVKRMTPEARPELADWGPPRGKEFW